MCMVHAHMLVLEMRNLVEMRRMKNVKMGKFFAETLNGDRYRQACLFRSS